LRVRGALIKRNPAVPAGPAARIRSRIARAEHMMELECQPDFAHELSARAEGAWPCAAAAEAGRGPLAGPVVAAAVILNPGAIPQGIDDSKRLTAARREALSTEILESALAVPACSVAAESIDRSDIRTASLAALARAVNCL